MSLRAGLLLLLSLVLLASVFFLLPLRCSTGPGSNEGALIRQGRDPRLERTTAFFWQGLDGVRREAWGAAPPRAGESVFEEAKTRITLHHSAIDSEPAFFGGYRRTVRGIQEFHQGERGWTDVAYHFLVDPAGEVYEARLLYTRGSHAGSSEANAGNLGICLIGNFEDKPPPAAQLAGLCRLLVHVETKLGLGLSTLATHREVKAEFGLPGTACPGEHLQEVVQGWRSRGRVAP
jgi:hypothetical protein